MGMGGGLQNGKILGSELYTLSNPQDRVALFMPLFKGWKLAPPPAPSLQHD